MIDGALNRLWVSGLAEFDEAVAWMQDLPDDDAYPVSDGPDPLDVADAGHQTFKDRFQMAPLGSCSGLSCLREQSPEEPVAFGAATGMVLASAFIGTGADADPGSQLRGRRKGCSVRSDLGQDFLGGFRADAGNLHEAHNRFLMWLHLGRRRLVQFFDLPVDQLDPVQMLSQ